MSQLWRKAAKDCTIHPIPKSSEEIKGIISFRMMVQRYTKFVMKMILHMVSMV
jgi:hypothetical protein